MKETCPWCGSSEMLESMTFSMSDRTSNVKVCPECKKADEERWRQYCQMHERFLKPSEGFIPSRKPLNE